MTTKWVRLGLASLVIAITVAVIPASQAQVGEASMWIGASPRLEFVGDGWIELDGRPSPLGSSYETVLGHEFRREPQFETRPLGAPDYQWGPIPGLFGGTASGAIWREYDRVASTGKWMFTFTPPQQRRLGCTNPVDDSTCTYSYTLTDLEPASNRTWRSSVFALGIDSPQYLFGPTGQYPDDTRNGVYAFVREDLETHELVPITTMPRVGTGQSLPFRVDVSGDGRYVVTGIGDTGRTFRFPGDPVDYFPRIYDLKTGEATHLGRMLGIYVTGSGDTEPRVDISADGTTIHFSSTSAALPGGDGTTLKTWRLSVDRTVEDCEYGDVTIVSAGGSGEPPRPGKFGDLLRGALAERLPPQSDVQIHAVDYPGNLGLAGILLGVFGEAGVAAVRDLQRTYLMSVLAGPGATIDLLRRIEVACGSRHPVVLVGFSQGAHAVQLALEALAVLDNPTSGLVVAVGLVASPMFKWDDPAARGTFAREVDGGAPHAHDELDTGRVPTRFAPQTRSWCGAGDPICGTEPANVTPRGLDIHTRTSTYDEAVTDFAALATWELERRGVAVLPAADAMIDGSVRATHMATTRLDPADSQWRITHVWWSAAALHSADSPLSTYSWDLDGDGTFEVESGAPTIETRYEWDKDGPTTTHSAVRVQSPRGLTETFALCWDLARRRTCSPPG